MLRDLASSSITPTIVAAVGIPIAVVVTKTIQKTVSTVTNTPRLMSDTQTPAHHQAQHHPHHPHRRPSTVTVTRPPSVSPVTGDPVPDHYLHASSVHFQDTHGRSVLLRGVNVSGGAKNPINCPSHSQDGFWEDAESGNVSFVNSILNLDDGSADVHLARLRAWGYNVLRFVFTWEGLEHKGPGQYDTEYMDYIVKCLYKCKDYGFRVYMDPHQDVWSRFTGGSGAPLWTLYACGVDPRNIVDTYSAFVYSDHPSKESPDPQSMPEMLWASNYYRSFNHTVWTLFFGGKTFAPKCMIDGLNIQDWLQGHFINAVRALAEHIHKAGGLYDECVLGWDSINEPAEGMIGLKDISVVAKEQPVQLGPVPTPFENMKLAMGRPVMVPNFTFTSMGPKKTGMVTLDPKGKKMWLSEEADKERGSGRYGWTRGDSWEMGTCIWAQHNVWDPDTNTLLHPTYFSALPSDPLHKVEFVYDFWRTHWMAYAAAVRNIHPEAIHFMNTSVFKPLPEVPDELLSGRACSTAHFYDGLTLMTKHWGWFNADALGILRGKYWSIMQGLRIGEPAIRKVMQEQLAVLKEDTRESIGNYPTLIGEIGCPYDMDKKKAYGHVDGGKGKGDYSAQQRAWDCSINACDGGNVLNYTMWTYVPNNSHKWGDNWYGEDLSLWSPDDMRATKAQLALGRSKEIGLVASDATPSLASSRTLAPVEPWTVSPKGIQNGTEVTAKLVLDGARAVGAICRPFPVAVVGVPDRINFDIKSSVFRLDVRVSPTDSAEQVTEIYVPFVHYASNMDYESVMASHSSQESLPSSDDSSMRSISKPAPLLPLELDIAVKVSIGTYTTHGQYLHWTYPVPARDSIYRIEIQRNGGALAIHACDADPSWGEIVANYLGSCCVL